MRQKRTPQPEPPKQRFSEEERRRRSERAKQQHLDGELKPVRSVWQLRKQELVERVGSILELRPDLVDRLPAELRSLLRDRASGPAPRPAPSPAAPPAHEQRRAHDPPPDADLDPPAPGSTADRIHDPDPAPRLADASDTDPLDPAPVPHEPSDEELAAARAFSGQIKPRHDGWPWSEKLPGQRYLAP